MRILNRFIDLSTRPTPLRALFMRKVLTRWPIGSYPARLYAGAVNRPWYGMCLYQAAEEAKALGYKAITAIEMGVAGGNGLLCMCDHRDEIRKVLGIDIEVKGFDSGVGLLATRSAVSLVSRVLQNGPPGFGATFGQSRGAYLRRCF
jgi:hypothetical protein